MLQCEQKRAAYIGDKKESFIKNFPLGEHDFFGTHTHTFVR